MRLLRQESDVNESVSWQDCPLIISHNLQKIRMGDRGQTFILHLPDKDGEHENGVAAVNIPIT